MPSVLGWDHLKMTPATLYSPAAMRAVYTVMRARGPEWICPGCEQPTPRPISNHALGVHFQECFKLRIFARIEMLEAEMYKQKMQGKAFLRVRHDAEYARRAAERLSHAIARAAEAR